jgi:membrane protein
VIPTTALGAVLNTFNETTSAASSGKITFGTIAAIWSASVGISAIQDTLNDVYKVEDSRSYVVARVYAVALTIVLTILVTLGLGCMFGGDFFATLADHCLTVPMVATAVAVGIRVVAWTAASCVLALSFEILYCWAPDWKQRRWRWLTPGTTIGVVGWLFASLGFRIYIHYFNTYTVTYGSLGAVIILLMWFYISGLMLLLGAEIDTVLYEAVGQTLR